MKLCIALILVALSYTNAHVFLANPIARTSIQLRPEFGASQPFWWDNFGVWCGNAQQNTAFSTCGRCGESSGNRDASQGGQFDKNIIVATYTAGSVRKIDRKSSFREAIHQPIVLSLLYRLSKWPLLFKQPITEDSRLNFVLLKLRMIIVSKCCQWFPQPKEFKVATDFALHTIINRAVSTISPFEFNFQLMSDATGAQSDSHTGRSTHGHKVSFPSI